jgi:uncharacterized protein
VRFWDTSALVPLFVSEAASETMRQLYRGDSQVAVAWTASMECTSACVRQHREGRFTDAHLTQLLARLESFERSWNLVEPSGDVRVGARRLVARHGLRAGDAIQLASAMATIESGSAAPQFVCLDRRLMLAATAEGLRVVPEAHA